MRFEVAMQTDIGQVRQNNEDTCFTFDTGSLTGQENKSYGIYIVADGMGGHQAGEVASHKAVEIIRSVLMDNTMNILNSDINAIIREAFQKANSEIYNLAVNDPLLKGMGTTVTLGFRNEESLYIGHVGDSRAYLIRAGEIIKLTRDHSLVENLKNAGMITEAESKNYPDRNIITRAVGTSLNIIVDSCKETIGEDSLSLYEKDKIVFCSDGLTNYVEDNEILEIVVRSSSLNDACKTLVDTANSRGGNDNITVIVVNSID